PPARRQEATAEQPVVAGRNEQTQRVPAPAPRVADSLTRVQDHEPLPSLRKLTSDRETRLTASDDHGLDSLRFAPADHRVSPLDLASETTLGGRLLRLIAETS